MAATESRMPSNSTRGHALTTVQPFSRAKLATRRLSLVIHFLEFTTDCKSKCSSKNANDFIYRELIELGKGRLGLSLSAINFDVAREKLLVSKQHEVFYYSCDLALAQV